MKDTLSKVLIEERNKKNLSLRKFSKLIGISHTYLAKLEKGYYNKSGNNIAPTLETLIKISNGLDIEVDKFLERCGYVTLINTGQENVQLSLYFSNFIDSLKSMPSLMIDENKLNEQEVNKLINGLELCFNKFIASNK